MFSSRAVSDPKLLALDRFAVERRKRENPFTLVPELARRWVDLSTFARTSCAAASFLSPSGPRSIFYHCFHSKMPSLAFANRLAVRVSTFLSLWERRKKSYYEIFHESFDPVANAVLMSHERRENHLDFDIHLVSTPLFSPTKFHPRSILPPSEKSWIHWRHNAVKYWRYIALEIIRHD